MTDSIPSHRLPKPAAAGPLGSGFACHAGRARMIVGMATIGKDGPTGTLQAHDGDLAW
jgi:hypothetical protein